ncbi:MAG: ABC transporter ATP-binding protein [Victivallaceae bacterium]|nr:ABC transporter ATP-binding protein [Victivallaceae bacterium]
MRRRNIKDISSDDLVKKYDRQSLEKVLPLIKPYRGLLIAAICTLIMFNSIGITMPWLLKIAIDRVIPNADYMLFWVLCGAMLIIYTARVLLRYVASYLVDYTGIRIMVDLRQKVFRHLQSLSLRFYEEYRTGKLISNVISDVALLQMMVRTMIQLGEQVFQLILIAGLLLVINWKMGLLVFISLPIHFFNFYHFRKVMRKDALVLQEKMSEISANLSETLTGVKVVKSFSKERSECLNFFQNLRPVVDMQMRLTVWGVGLWTVFDMVSLATYLSTIGLGIIFVKDYSITIGEFVAFYSYVGMLLGPVNVLSGLTMTFTQGMVGASRIVNLLNTIPEITEVPNAIRPENIQGNIVFEHVNFGYGKGGALVINNFTLNIRPGQKVALVGPSGSGKSTITNLLLRFYDIDSGAIRVDNIDIRKMNLDSYRNNIGVVLQEPFLFSGSIRENIAYAKRDATNDEIEESARLANVSEFVERLPDGFDTVIGENGASLSGGQKQRLAIARAVLKNPTILILDEATSALDTVSEFLVQEALDRLMEGKTTIIIAHRLSTIKNADVIVVLDSGKIVQKGTHLELMEQQGIYSDLYQTQKKMAEQGVTTS